MTRAMVTRLRISLEFIKRVNILITPGVAVHYYFNINNYIYIIRYIVMSRDDISRLLIAHSNRQPIHPTLFQFAKNTDKAYRMYMLGGTVAAVVAGVASPFFMIFFSTISQIFIPGNQSNAIGQSLDLLVKLLIVGFVTWISRILLTILDATSMWAWNKSGSRLATQIKKLYYAALLKQEVQWFDSYQTSKIAAELSQNTLVIEAALGEKISFAISALTTSIFGFTFAFLKCWQMSLYLAAFLPLMLLGGYLMIRFMSMKAHASKISYENASAVVETAFGSIRTVKILGGEKFQSRKFNQALSGSQPKLIRHLMLSSLSSGLMNLIMMGLYAFGFFIGKDMIINQTGDASPSDIISTFFCFMVAGQSIGQISPIFKNAVEAHQAYAKIFQLVSRDQALIEKQDGIIINNIQTIQVQNLSFFYPRPDEKLQEGQPERKMILKNFNLRLTRGRMTAVIGSSGCGKSTLSQLLLRFYEPRSGQILVNEIKLNKLDTKEYRQKIGYVGQEPVLFSTSIKENIRLSNPKITDSQIVEVLKLCKAWSFVSKLADGIDTYVGSKGNQLSGGQKQRIAIARALAKRPDVLILDEATSALDAESEKDILSMLREQRDQIITLFITHRLPSITEADTIVVVKEGAVVGEGSHQQLLHSSSFYNELMKSTTYNQQKHQPGKEEKQQVQKINASLVKQTAPTLPQGSSERKQQGFIKIWREKKIYYELLLKSDQFRKYLLVGSLFAVLNGLVYPFFNVTFSNVMGLMADADVNSSEINTYCFYFLIVAIAAGLSNFGHNYAFGVYGEKIVLRLRIQVFDKMLKLPCSFFDQRQNSPGSLSTRLSQDSYQLNNFLTGILSVVCLNLSIIVASLSFAFYFSWKLTLILLIFSPLMAAKGAIATQVLKRMSKRADELQITMGSFVSDTITNIKTVKSFGGYEQFLVIFNKSADETESLKSVKFLKLGILQGFSKSSAIFVYSIMFWVAAVFFVNGQFSDPRDALIAIFCIIFSASTVGQNSQYLPDIIKAEKAAKSILNTLKTKDEFQIAKRIQQTNLKHHRIKGKIQFKNVDFQYPQRNERVLTGFNLTINAGERVAVVGQSGSGKSSLILILARLYPIQSGLILLDEVPIQKYPLRKYRKYFGVLFQEPTVFTGSIHQNILYQLCDSQKYKKRVPKYCQISAVDQIIAKYKEQPLKQVGSGNQISGGQKQRISLTRCLIRRPKIYLLDEPTSALDSKTEAKIFEGFISSINKNTFIYSTHRFNILNYADTIVAMKHGKIIQQGSYDQLIKRKEYLYKLANVEKSYEEVQ